MSRAFQRMLTGKPQAGAEKQRLDDQDLQGVAAALVCRIGAIKQPYGADCLMVRAVMHLARLRQLT